MFIYIFDFTSPDAGMVDNTHSKPHGDYSPTRFEWVLSTIPASGLVKSNI
jgi:hypothetical protein